MPRNSFLPASNPGLPRLGILLIGTLVAATLLIGQAFYGSIVGTVTDQSGAAVAGATVNLVNTGTSEARSAKADQDGAYRFVNLNPGMYKLEIEQSGFKHYTRDRIEVNVQAAVRADVALEVGDVTQSVEVSAEAPLLQTENASLSQVVAARSVQELPLNGRNVLNLINIAPGVVPQGGSEGSLTGKNVFAAGNYQIGGGTANQSAAYYDGVAVNVAYGNMIALVPSQDAVSEFRVQTNSLSAEWGRYTGGVINMASKGGSNGFHGTAYEFLRNRALNAGTFFGNATGVGKPAFSQNQFGGTVGGPVIKDKTFFFASYEGYRQRQGLLFLNTVPDLEKQTGNFSNYRNAGGNVIPVYDPATQCGTGNNAACPATGPQRQQFPGNIIPASRIHPVAANYLKFKYWANPNITGQTFTNLFNFSRNVSTGGDNDQLNFRWDHNLSEKQRLMMRYSRWKSTNVPEEPYGNGLIGGAPERFLTQQAVVSHTWSIDPTSVLDIRLGFTRWAYDRTPGTLGLDIPAVTGLPAYYNDLDRLNGLSPSVTIPVMNLAGYNSVNTGLIYGIANNYSVSPSLTKIMGRHTLKVGGEVRNLQLNYYQNNTAGGTFTFNNLFTSQNALSPGATGDAFASFLLGLPASGTVQTSLFTATGMRYQGYYVNDSWQVNNKLTVNLGLRWEIPGVYTERFDRQTSFDMNAINSVVQQAGITVNGQPVKGSFNLVGTDGHPERGLRPERYKLFAPRVGIAYRLTNRTVLRAGGGIFYIPADTNFPEAPLQAAVNYINNDMAATANNSVTPLNTLSNPYPGGFVAPPQRNANFQNTLLGVAGVRSPQRIEEYGYTAQWNFTIQHQLPGGVAIEGSYSALRGVHLPRGNPGRQLNVIPTDVILREGSRLTEQVANPFLGLIKSGLLANPTIPRGQLLRPFPQYLGNIDFGAYIGNSNYHSLQTKVEKRLSKGGMVLMSYTFSKLISDAETFTNWLEGGSVAGTQDFSNLRLEKALSSFDSRQRLTFSFVYDLPFGNGNRFGSKATGLTNKLISGWGFNGLLTFQEGFPLGLSATPNQLSQYDTGLRPNVIAGCAKEISGPIQQRLNRYFNTSCFAVPAPFTFGNESRTDPNLRGHGVNNVDFAMFKKTPITETTNLEFRVESFNLFNRVKFANPNLTANTAANNTFGVISSQANTPRLLQLALRFSF